MPTQGAIKLNPGTAAESTKWLPVCFSHADEVAEEAYYRVKLDDHNIVATDGVYSSLRRYTSE